MSNVHTMPASTQGNKKKPPGASLMFFGILLPAGTIAVELTTGICAEAFFDPIPTIWHLLLVSFVPFSNLLIWAAAYKGESRNVKLLSWSNGIAIGIASFYSLLFFPMFPAALIGLIFLIGILPLAPISSLISAFKLRTHLKQVTHLETRSDGLSSMSGLGFGMLIALMLLVAIELPSTVTSYYLHEAVSDSAARKSQGAWRAWHCRCPSYPAR